MDFTDRDAESWMVYAKRVEPAKANPGEARPLKWPDRYVQDKDEREALKLWLWCRSNGIAFRSLCERRGLSHSTWLRRKNLAVARISTGLNVEASLKNTG